MPKKHQEVHKTEIAAQTTNPKWAAFDLTVGAFCGGDSSQEVTISVHDWDEVERGKSGLIGSTTVTLMSIGTMELGAGKVWKPKTFTLINQKKATKASKKGTEYTNSGVLVLARAEGIPAL